MKRARCSFLQYLSKQDNKEDKEQSDGDIQQSTIFLWLNIITEIDCGERYFLKNDEVYLPSRNYKMDWRLIRLKSWSVILLCLFSILYTFSPPFLEIRNGIFCNLFTSRCILQRNFYIHGYIRFLRKRLLFFWDEANKKKKKKNLKDASWIFIKLNITMFYKT